MIIRLYFLSAVKNKDTRSSKKSSIFKRKSNLMSRVVHFEIPANEPEKIMEFFKKTFDWKFQQFGAEQYWVVMTGDEKSPGINGGIMKKRDPNQPMVNSINVENIDKAMADVSSNGGTIVVPKMPIPGVGWMCYFKDPESNIHGLYQNDPTAKM
jgi:predicted enzyme related to lactoylglutathione lyase